MKIRTANAPVSWGIMEVEGWGPTLAYTDFLDELKSAGYEGTELGPYGFMPTRPEEIAPELRRRSLALISAFVPLRLKEPGLDLEPARQVGRLLNGLGAGHMVIADSLWPEREAVAGRVDESDAHLTDADWEQVVVNVGAARRLAEQYGLRCVFHHHAGTYIETPAEVARLLESTDIGLCLDTGHYVYGGGDPVEAVRSFGARVEYLHFKDLNLERLRETCRARKGFLDGVRDGVFCELGRGCVRFPELLQGLDEIGYDGWAVVEQDVDLENSSQSPLASAIASRRFLRDKLGI
jgi:inosose dehydratase